MEAPQKYLMLFWRLPKNHKKIHKNNDVNTFELLKRQNPWLGNMADIGVIDNPLLMIYRLKNWKRSQIKMLKNEEGLNRDADAKMIPLHRPSCSCYRMDLRWF